MNKTISSLLGWFIILFLCIVTYLSYGFVGSIFYTNESADYLTSLSEINVWLAIITIISFASCYFFIKNKYVWLISIVLCLFLYFFSVRKIGFSVVNGGRINAGWACFMFYESSICKNSEETCQNIVYYQTNVQQLSFWRIRVKNESFNEVFFIGPFVWNNAILALEDIGSGTFTSNSDWRERNVIKLRVFQTPSL